MDLSTLLKKCSLVNKCKYFHELLILNEIILVDKVFSFFRAEMTWEFNYILPIVFSFFHQTFLISLFLYFNICRTSNLLNYFS